MNYQQIDSCFSKSLFPYVECVERDEREPDIYYGSKQYMCICIDKRFVNTRTIRLMRPYIQRENGNIIGYAWIDDDGNWIDNLWNPLHGVGYSDEFVTGWTDYCDDDEKYIEQYTKLFD